MLIFEKSSCRNQVQQTVFLQATQAVKIRFEVHRIKILFVELDFSKLIFQISSKYRPTGGEFSQSNIYYDGTFVRLSKQTTDKVSDVPGIILVLL